MSGLIKYPEVLADKMKLMVTEEEKNSLILIECTKASDATNQEYVTLIQSVYAYLGHKTDVEDIASQAIMLRGDCKTIFKSLSFEEVRTAINNALRAEIEPLKYASVANYKEAIYRYVNDIKTQNAKRAVFDRLYPLPVEPELSAEEKEALSQKGYERLKEKVAKGESIIDDLGALGCYLWLKKKGKLDGIMNEEERAAVKERATQLLQAEFTAKANTLNKDVRRAALKKAQDLINGMLPNDLNAMCQKLALEILMKDGRV